jgi:predicted transcriptional regulator
MSADDITKLTVRVPSDLKNRLQAQATEEGCSTSSFIVYALDTFLTDQDRKNASNRSFLAP